MFELNDCRYMLILGCLQDHWRLTGECPEHPNANRHGIVCPSHPVELDEENLILTTLSGKKYKLNSFCENTKEQTIAEIKKDIQFYKDHK